MSFCSVLEPVLDTIHYRFAFYAATKREYLTLTTDEALEAINTNHRSGRTNIGHSYRTDGWDRYD